MTLGGSTVLKKENKNFFGGWLDPKYSIVASQVFEIVGTVYKSFLRFSYKLPPK